MDALTSRRAVRCGLRGFRARWAGSRGVPPRGMLRRMVRLRSSCPGGRVGFCCRDSLRLISRKRRAARASRPSWSAGAAFAKSVRRSCSAALAPAGPCSDSPACAGCRRDLQNRDAPGTCRGTGRCRDVLPLAATAPPVGSRTVCQTAQTPVCRQTAGCARLPRRRPRPAAYPGGPPSALPEPRRFRCRSRCPRRKWQKPPTASVSEVAPGGMAKGPATPGPRPRELRPAACPYRRTPRCLPWT